MVSMTAFDFGVAVAFLGAVASGWRRGLVEPATRWFGMAVAGVAAIRNTEAVAAVADRVGLQRSGTSVVAGVMAAVAAGGLLGSLAGRSLLTVVAVPGLRSLDRAAGSAVGAAGVVFIVWLMAPVAAILPGGLAQSVHDGRLTDLAVRTLPAPPDLFAPVRSVADTLGAGGVGSGGLGEGGLGAGGLTGVPANLADPVIGS